MLTVFFFRLFLCLFLSLNTKFTVIYGENAFRWISVLCKETKSTPFQLNFHKNTSFALNIIIRVQMRVGPHTFYLTKSVPSLKKVRTPLLWNDYSPLTLWGTLLFAGWEHSGAVHFSDFGWQIELWISWATFSRCTPLSCFSAFAWWCQSSRRSSSHACS